MLLGREKDLRPLTAAIDDAAGGAGGLILVAGEAGIGKTSLVSAGLVHARTAGGVVATGTCWDRDGAPGLWPWMQVVRALRREVGTESWDAASSVAGAGLDRLLEGGASPSAAASSFEVLDAVTTLVTTLAHERFVVVVMEDLHWADQASLSLLSALVGPARFGRLLLVGTFRSDEVAAVEHPNHGSLAELGARAFAVPLSGLDLAACQVVLDVAGVHEVDVGEVHRRTGGNPFFVRQLAQLWRANEGQGPMPPGIESLVARRLARLPAAVADALTAASVLAPSFEPALLAAILGTDDDDASQRLGVARDTGLVTSGSDGWRFVHDLVRESLLAATPAVERRRLHAAATRALSARAPASVPAVTTQIANHAALAVPEIPAREAVELLLVAAGAASARLAADEAAAHLERALGLLDDGDRSRAAIQLDLAAEHRRGGRVDASRMTLGELLESDDPVTFARAALGLHVLGTFIHDEEGRHHALREAYTRLVAAADLDPDFRDALLARVLAAIVRGRVHHTELDRSDLDALSAEAVAIARRSGDPSVLAFALLARHDAIWRPDTPDDRLALALEMAAAARAGHDHEMELQGIELEFVARAELADRDAMRTVDRYVELSERLQLPRCRYRALSRQATVATIQGRFDDAQALIEEAYALGARIGEIDREGVYCDQSWEIARQRGDLGCVSDLVTRFADDPSIAVIEIDLHLQRRDFDAVDRLDRRFAELGVVWPLWARTIWWTAEADIAIGTGDVDRCRDVRARLAPLSGRCAVLGGGVIVRGPIDLWIARLDLALGDLDRAVAGFETARAIGERLGARPWVVHARTGLARALRQRNGPGDDSDAAAAAHAAAIEADRLGVALVDVAEPAHRRHGQLRRDGDVWLLELDGAAVRLPDAKGLRDLHTLVANPGVDIPAVTLLDPTRNAVAPTGADAVLDEQARAAYRQRLHDLDAEIARALDREADTAAQRLDLERDALIAELKGATGLGGRPRRLGDDAERARKAVTGRIRDSLRRLHDRHPVLADHLQASITTGATCRYDPKEDITWRT